MTCRSKLVSRGGFNPESSSVIAPATAFYAFHYGFGPKSNKQSGQTIAVEWPLGE